MTNEQTGCRCAKVGKTAYYITKWVEHIDGKAVVEGDVGGNFCPECGRPFHLRPMTLEEIKELPDYPVWFETKRGILSDWRVPSYTYRENSNPEILFFEDDGGQEMNDYGRTWRCWRRRPTREKSAAWEWEEGATHE